MCINKNVQSVSEAQSEESVPLDDSQAATQADNNTASLGINSSEFSESKDTTISPTTNELGKKSLYNLNTSGSGYLMLKDMEALRKSNRDEYERIQPAYELFYKAKDRGLYPNEIAELKGILKGTSLEGKIDGWFTPVVEEQLSTNGEKSQEIEDYSTTGVEETAPSASPERRNLADFKEGDVVHDYYDKKLYRSDDAISVEEDDVLFRLTSEKGAAEIDAKEGVTTRMDALELAKAMEARGYEPWEIEVATKRRKIRGRQWRYDLGKKVQNPNRELYNSYLTDEEINFANVPISKALGKPRGTRKQRREFAARQRQEMAERVERLAKRSKYSLEVFDNLQGIIKDRVQG